MCASSVERDQPCSMAWAVYHSRWEASETLVSSVTMWNHGNWAAGCCPIRRAGHISAKTFMYFRFRLEHWPSS